MPGCTQLHGQSWDSGLHLCVTQVHVLSLLVVLTPETACSLEFLPGREGLAKWCGRKKWLQTMSNLYFGAKDASDLFTNQHITQAKENFIHLF